MRHNGSISGAQKVLESNRKKMKYKTVQKSNQKKSLLILYREKYRLNTQDLNLLRPREEGARAELAKLAKRKKQFKCLIQKCLRAALNWSCCTARLKL